jgi:hypothetical protein
MTETSPQRKPQDPALRQCTRDGCTGPVEHPRDRTPGRVVDDYCSEACAPAWLVGLVLDPDTLGNYATRPVDVWLRSGEPTMLRWSDVPARFAGDGLGAEATALAAYRVEQQAMVAALAEVTDEDGPCQLAAGQPCPVEVKLCCRTPRAPRNHVSCARCRKPVHKIHAVWPKRGDRKGQPLCPDCVVVTVRIATGADPLCRICNRPVLDTPEAVQVHFDAEHPGETP